VRHVRRQGRARRRTETHCKEQPPGSTIITVDDLENALDAVKISCDGQVPVIIQRASGEFTGRRSRSAREDLEMRLRHRRGLSE
jgi:hypothetical protein